MAQMQPVSFGGVMLGATATTIGTVSANGKWIFQKLTFHNSGADNASVEVYLVPSGATPQASYDKVDSGAMALATMRGRSRA